jgi:hypothetical protein
MASMRDMPKNHGDGVSINVPRTLSGAKTEGSVRKATKCWIRADSWIEVLEL